MENSSQQSLLPGASAAVLGAGSLPVPRNFRNYLRMRRGALPAPNLCYQGPSPTHRQVSCPLGTRTPGLGKRRMFKFKFK